MCFDRTKPDEELEKCMDSRNIQEYPKGTLFEVSGLERKTGEHGEYGVATCSSVVNGKRETGRVRLSANALAGFHATPPCLLLYCGTRQGRSGRTFVDVAVTKLPESAEYESMKEVADNWRKMSFAALRGLMQTQPLDNFPKNTVFVYKEPRKKLLRKGATEDSLVVDFETTVNGEVQTGCLALPKRLEEMVVRHKAGILLWRGSKMSKDGRQYNDVVVLDVDSAEAFASVSST